MKKILLASAAVLPLMAGNVQADIQHLDDVIIGFSLCVGNDCVNGESFGFDTLRLKENNVRMHFDDTSSSASFPKNDWRLVANDSSNGGGEYLAIEDSTAGRQVFRVEAGARANALYVEADSDVGIGTSNPVVDLHVVSGDSPTLRLDQDGSSGFTPQTWDIAGNEAGFFVRDVTHGSALSFRILPGADSEALVIDANGEVGINSGTTPDDDLHITDAGAARIRLENTTITNDATQDQIWIVNSNGTFRIGAGTTGASEFTLEAKTGNLEIMGALTTGGTTCGMGGCDFVFDSRYDMPTIDEHAAQMWKNKYLPAVGPTQENAPFNVTEKTTGMLNELEKAHIFIEQLSNKIDARDNVIADLHDRIVALEKH